MMTSIYNFFQIGGENFQKMQSAIGNTKKLGQLKDKLRCRDKGLSGKGFKS